MCVCEREREREKEKEGYNCTCTNQDTHIPRARIHIFSSLNGKHIHTHTRNSTPAQEMICSKHHLHLETHCWDVMVDTDEKKWLWFSVLPQRPVSFLGHTPQEKGEAMQPTFWSSICVSFHSLNSALVIPSFGGSLAGRSSIAPSCLAPLPPFPRPPFAFLRSWYSASSYRSILRKNALPCLLNHQQQHPQPNKPTHQTMANGPWKTLEFHLWIK